MKFIRHSPFFHEYDFPVSKVLSKWREGMLEDYRTTPRPPLAYNIPLHYKALYDYLEPNFHKLVQYWYNVPPATSPHEIGLYVQDNKSSKNEWHTHADRGINLTSIVATLYLHDLKENEGGGIEIAIPPDEPITIKTQKDKIYLFPNWLLHRPLPQTSPEKRICLNWGYITNKKFIHRTSGDAW